MCFSKHRTGLFNKASELSILYGAKIGVVIFSPAKKALSFAHPSIDVVFDRFLTGNPHHGNNGGLAADSHHGVVVCELNRQYMELHGLLDTERKWHDALEEAMNA